MVFSNCFPSQPCVFLKYRLCFIKFKFNFTKYRLYFIKHNLYFKKDVAGILIVVVVVEDVGGWK